jgi:hypothetical protein
MHFDVHGAVLTHARLAQLGSLSTQTYQARLTDRYARSDLTPPPAEAADVPKAYLFFEAETANDVDPAEADELARLLREYHIPIAVLNACQSGQQIGDTETSLGSRLLQAGMQTVMAMVLGLVGAAVLMMQTLYQSLLHQRPARRLPRGTGGLAPREERRAQSTHHLEDWLCPSSTSPGGDIRPRSPCGR